MAIVAALLFFASILLHELGQGPGRAHVLDGDRLVGILSISDLARALETGGGRRRRGRR